MSKVICGDGGGGYLFSYLLLFNGLFLNFMFLNNDFVFFMIVGRSGVVVRLVFWGYLSAVFGVVL